MPENYEVLGHISREKWQLDSDFGVHCTLDHMCIGELLTLILVASEGRCAFAGYCRHIELYLIFSSCKFISQIFRHRLPKRVGKLLSREFTRNYLRLLLKCY